MLEIFEFQPQLPPTADPVEPGRPDALSASTSETLRSGTTISSSKGVECLSKPERSPRGHSFFFAKDFDGNLIEMIDLGYMYYVLQWLGPLGGLLFRRGMYRQDDGKKV